MDSKNKTNAIIVALFMLFFVVYPAQATSDTIYIRDSSFQVVKEITNAAEIDKIDLIITRAQKYSVHNANSHAFSHKIDIKSIRWLYDVESGGLKKLTKARTPIYSVAGDDFCVLYHKIYPEGNTCPQELPKTH